MKRYVILGNGVAGQTCAEELRKLDASSAVAANVWNNAAATGTAPTQAQLQSVAAQAQRSIGIGI